ncbi:hypothetical protein ESZ91_09565 [Candidatus Borkfalkia ceftriaxoniphila]|uniref:Uncharacterized protein n=1 Tax=Candidatus Borkfalkia ceftriaxoniphila TaxID=2508949 RepID=A0A4Q2K5Z3_9FIRM|nr:hypothetical protein [Candidatus Borkfalkia ceftriaxoniphila]RXZ58292.1 hypothetical protein ESZ91_09565 [Candidatus Borkfalkia ceftriaxoniphila]
MTFPELYRLGKKLFKADRIFYALAFFLLFSAFLLETYPEAAAAIRFSQEGERIPVYASYFSPLLQQYGNSYPLACGVMTVLITASAALCLGAGLRSLNVMYATLAGNILTMIFALMPLVAIGKDCVTAVGVGVLSCLFAAILLQTAVIIYENLSKRKK